MQLHCYNINNETWELNLPSLQLFLSQDIFVLCFRNGCSMEMVVEFMLPPRMNMSLLQSGSRVVVDHPH